MAAQIAFAIGATGMVWITTITAYMLASRLAIAVVLASLYPAIRWCSA